MTAPRFGIWQRLAAEALGTGFLLAAIIGSGIMAARLSGGNTGLTLLCNAIATGAMLFVLISIFANVSGAHFNPAVSLVFAWRKELAWRDAAGYCAVQVGGGIAGVLVAHAMFAEPLFQVSTHLRQGPGQWLSESVASFGLLAAILGAQKSARRSAAAIVALYIVAAYWFTASTSFANPAVTIARSLSDSFAGIAPGSVAGFITAQLAGAAAGSAALSWLLRRSAP